MIIASLILVALAGSFISCVHPRQYLVIGSRTFGNGVGNTLLYYPAAYFFAVVENRTVVVDDHSDIGLMCGVIQCGFKLLSKVDKGPSNSKVSIVDVKHWTMFTEHYHGRPLTARYLRLVGSNTAKADWIVAKEPVSASASKVALHTGCLLGDLRCAMWTAYRHLFIGPLHPSFRNYLRLIIPSLPEIETLPWLRAPRIDVAIHIRNQFLSFEKKQPRGLPLFGKEVRMWLESRDCAEVFAMFRHKVEQLWNVTRSCNMSSSTFFVYIAGDDVDVKAALQTYLLQSPALVHAVVALQSYEAVHISSQAHTRGPQAVASLALDWYLLSLARAVLGWRGNGVTLASTFMHSAQRMGGTILKSDARGSNGSTPSAGLVLQRRSAKNSALVWRELFQYKTAAHDL